MSAKRKLKVAVKNPLGVITYDAKRKEFRPSAAADLGFLERPETAAAKSLDLFRYSDQDRALRLFILNKARTWTLIGSLAIKGGSPGERSVMELVRNRKAAGTDYDLPVMMSELFAYKFRRRHGEHSARPCPAGDDLGYYPWSVPSVDLGAPRVTVFSGADIMYLTGCYDRRAAGLLADELTAACRAMSLAYQCHVALCEFFDSFVEAAKDAGRKSGRYYSEVPAEKAVIGKIDAGVTRELFGRLDRAHCLTREVQRHEDDSEELLWEAKMRETDENAPGDED